MPSSSSCRRTLSSAGSVVGSTGSTPDRDGEPDRNPTGTVRVGTGHRCRAVNHHEPVHQVSLVTALVIGVIAISGLARRLRFPAPILLVAAGVVVSYLPGVPAIRLDPELVLVVLLPPLLYSAASKSSLIDIR